VIAVAVYARVSTTDQHAEMQIAELREYATRRDWTIFREYIDEGVSGTRASRPALDQMMKDARRKRFDAVVVWRFDRFARSTSHLLSALDEFRTLGIDFVSLHEAIDTSTALGKMVFTIIASVAELERSIIIERVRAGIQRAKTRGVRLGRPNGSKIDEKEIRLLRARGLSIRAIADATGFGVGSVHRIIRSKKPS